METQTTEAVTANPKTHEDFVAFNAALAKCLKGLKKDAGAVNIRQGYKGTGSQNHRQQVFVRFANDSSIDLWLNADHIKLGGVMTYRPGAQTREPLAQQTFPYTNLTPAEVYALVAPVLKAWGND